MPFSVHHLQSPIPLPSQGRPTRLNFDKPISDDDGLVSTGPAWSFRAPADGVYFIQASVQVSPGVDLVVNVMTRRPAEATSRTLAKSSYLASAVPANQVQTMAFLTRSDEVWFEAGHSMGDHVGARAIDGIASLALLYPSAARG